MADPTPADILKGLQSEAEALAKRQAATAADAKAMMTAYEDGERDIGTYRTEHDKLESDTNAAKADLKELIDRIKQHAPAAAGQVDGIITAYDNNLTAKKTAYATAKTEADAAETAMKAAQKTADDKQADFDTKKNRRLKPQLDNLQKAAKAADVKNDVNAFAEAYAIAKLPHDAAVALPAVGAYATDVRNAWEALRAAREILRQKTDDYIRAARKLGDLQDTIQELQVKRADNILKQVVEASPAAPPAPQPAPPGP